MKRTAFLFAIVAANGNVVFVDNPAEDPLRLTETSEYDEPKLVLTNMEGEQLAIVSVEECDRGQVLKFHDGNGRAEVWHKCVSDDGQPRIVRRSRSSISRNWTKEGQEGSPKASTEVWQKETKRDDLGVNELSLRTLKVQSIKQRHCETYDRPNIDGLLTLSELCQLLRKGRPDITDEEVYLLFKEVDLAGLGKIRFDEFVEFVFFKDAKLADDNLLTTARLLCRRLSSVD